MQEIVTMVLSFALALQYILAMFLSFILTPPTPHEGMPCNIVYTYRYEPNMTVDEAIDAALEALYHASLYDEFTWDDMHGNLTLMYANKNSLSNFISFFGSNFCILCFYSSLSH